ncbi:uncharacterized protein LOC111881041 [Lactuca sativa]|uniref:uncharacterized protein LOC111881041 n=1 Tax=Lactuca sativa TaxID=4236 RepID=UPI000CD962BD|nr:uncharacterized protein LOC111881041 [Lactuca sativa]
MPIADVDSVSSTNNRLIIKELDYNIPVMMTEFDHMFLALTNEQHHIFLDIMSTVKHNKGGAFFVYGYGGIEEYVCKINRDSDLATLLRKTSLIIWDEAPMVHKHAFEALDRSLKVVFRSENSTNSDIPFEGKVIVFGGDFRQVLPVIPGGSRQNIGSTDIEKKVRDFAKWLLDIGEGKLGGINDGETVIDIPDDILINDPHDPIGSLIDFVYPSILEKYNNTSYFQERAILSPKNEVVREINDCLLSKFPGNEVEYLSLDSICQSEFVHDQYDANLYSPEVLNGLKVSGLPNHKLVLKVDILVMLLRNIYQKNGLCNRTRLQVISLGKYVIEARIIELMLETTLLFQECR